MTSWRNVKYPIELSSVMYLLIGFKVELMASASLPGLRGLHPEGQKPVPERVVG
jgi:hypothetical protein